MSAKYILYYVDAQGRNPVSREIEKLAPKDRAKIAAYLVLLRREGEELRRPVADYLGNKLYELRPGPHRILYFFFLRDKAVLLHLFRKRSDRLPDWERRVALNRMSDFIRRNEKGGLFLEELA